VSRPEIWAGHTEVLDFVILFTMIDLSFLNYLSALFLVFTGRGTLNAFMEKRHIGVG